MFQGKRPAIEEPEVTEPIRTGRLQTPRVTAAALVMGPESYPWLQWPGASANRRIELNNRLALHQDKGIGVPRIMDWGITDALGINEELDRRFLTRLIEQDHIELEIPIWRRALDIKEDSYREWMLEFYSSLEIKKVNLLQEGNDPRMIRFRLGGEERHVTVQEFGRLAGLLTNDEANHRNIVGYLIAGVWDDKEILGRGVDAIWNTLSGQEAHDSSSKANQIVSPILRVLHKLVSYAFYQRTTQHDKVYEFDLWLLEFFRRNDPTQYVNVIWALVSFMQVRGPGRNKSSQMVCGHFITRIAKNLGIASPANMRGLSPRVRWIYLTKHDFETSRLLSPGGNHLIAEEEADSDEQREQQGERPSSSSRRVRKSNHELLVEMCGMFGQMGRQVNRIDRNVTGVGEYIGYHTERYQPSWEYGAQQYYASLPASSSGPSPWTPYAPPMMFPPSPTQEEMETEEEEE